MGEKSSTILQNDRHYINPFNDFSKGDKSLPIDVDTKEVITIYVCIFNFCKMKPFPLIKKTISYDSNFSNLLTASQRLQRKINRRDKSLIEKIGKKQNELV